MRTDRNRQAEALDDLDRFPDDQDNGTIGMLLVTKTCSSYPTSAGAVYCCNPVRVDADDTEGAAAVFTADTSVLIFALNIGSGVPAVGSYHVGTAVGGRTIIEAN